MSNPHHVGQMWDTRFASAENGFLYGTKPNDWIASRLPRLEASARVLALADGEGRNTVWLAQQGYRAENWDYSQVGLDKTQLLAQSCALEVITQHKDLTCCEFESCQFDAIVSSFFHLPKQHQMKVWQGIVQLLKPQGHLIVQVFAESQLGRNTGGPKDIELLYKTEMFDKAFSNLLEIQFLEENETQLDEGHLHQGTASVINLHAIKR